MCTRKDLASINPDVQAPRTDIQCKLSRAHQMYDAEFTNLSVQMDEIGIKQNTSKLLLDSRNILDVNAR